MIQKDIFFVPEFESSNIQLGAVISQDRNSKIYIVADILSRVPKQGDIVDDVEAVLPFISKDE